MMKILIAPAKRMKVDPVDGLLLSVPVFHRESLRLREWLKTLEDAEMRKMLNCSKLQFVKEKECVFAPYIEETAALFAYDGIQYKQIDADSLSVEDLSYLNEHLRILSAMYGVLRPLDAIAPYRLEMKAGCSSMPSMYRFWGRFIAEEVMKESDLVVDLASKEYSKAVLGDLEGKCRVLHIEFKAPGVWAKILRGRMVRYAVEHRIEDPQGLKQFSYAGYEFDPDRSDEEKYVFAKCVE